MMRKVRRGINEEKVVRSWRVRNEGTETEGNREVKGGIERKRERDRNRKREKKRWGRYSDSALDGMSGKRGQPPIIVNGDSVF